MAQLGFASASALAARNCSMNLVSNSPARKSGVGKDRLMQRDRGLDALHDELAERALHLGHGLGAVAAMNNQLGDQRIVVRRHHALGVQRRIHAHAVAAGHVEGRNLACRRGKFDRMLSVDAALDRVAANFELGRQYRLQPLAGGDQQLRLHQCPRR